MASITCTDSAGTVTLTNATLSTPGRRFRNVQPGYASVGPSATALGPQTVHRWLFAENYTATLELPYLKATDQAAAVRITRHLTGVDTGTGGSATLTTDDASGATYTVTLNPGTTPTFALEDRVAMDYTYTVSVRNTAAAPIVVDY